MLTYNPTDKLKKANQKLQDSWTKAIAQGNIAKASELRTKYNQNQQVIFAQIMQENFAKHGISV